MTHCCLKLYSDPILFVLVAPGDTWLKSVPKSLGLSGSALDTQSTASWVGMGPAPEDSPSGVLPAMPLHELLSLPKEEIGVVLWSEEFRLSPGSKAFGDFWKCEFMEEACQVLADDTPDSIFGLARMVREVMTMMLSSLILGVTEIGNQTFGSIYGWLSKSWSPFGSLL